MFVTCRGNPGLRHHSSHSLQLFFFWLDFSRKQITACCPTLHHGDPFLNVPSCSLFSFLISISHKLTSLLFTSSLSPYALFRCPGCRLANTLFCRCKLSGRPSLVTGLSKISAFLAIFWWLFVVMELSGNWLAVSLSERRSRPLWVNECQCRCPVLKTNNLIPP